jgi:hypothetical protein
MQTVSVKASAIVVLGAAMIVGAAYAAGRSSASSGAAPYTPTQLEWFVLKLNAAQRAPPTDTQPGFWFQEGGKDTVMVLLTGCGGTMKVSDIIDRAEEAEALAKSWGRDLPWLKTKVEVCGRPLESLKRK